MYWNKMQLNLRMAVALIVMTSVLCTILLKILYRLRSALPWRVNCWFCNSNTWVKISEHNQWTCPKCEQYNGFTKDGDYNKPIITTNDQFQTTPKLFQKSPPSNGLCKMCNINQQLKVTQLANFVPMNDKSFYEEIENYRMQLEKAYKLCSPCRTVLQIKLFKEKQTLLNTKLLENRSPHKKETTKENPKRKAMRNFINNISMLIAAILLMLISYECYTKVMECKNLPKTISIIIELVKELLDKLGLIIKRKFYMTFPSLAACYYEMKKEYFKMLSKIFDVKWESFVYSNIMTQEVLAVIACMLQVVANVWKINSIRCTIAIDLLWITFVISIAEWIVSLDPILTTVIRMTSILMLLLVYKNIEKPGRNTLKQSSPNQRIITETTSTLIKQDEADSDDVSLNKFGIQFDDSSNETISPLSKSLINGRTFSPRNDSMSAKPPHNLTFCVNPVMSSPKLTKTVFAKPSFNKYQKQINDDSDSDLDESISSLSLGDPTKSKNKTNSIFSLRKFTASPFVAPMASGRPLISPSRLGHSTSWVAGGYWGTENGQNVVGCRSSSQSFAFESQTSSENNRNVFSHPPSWKESVCGVPTPALYDRFNISSYHSQPQNFSRISTPVYPQMQYNSHVHLPQARFPRHTPNVFIHQSPYAMNGMFKSPGTSGLIKFPQMKSFAIH